MPGTGKRPVSVGNAKARRLTTPLLAQLKEEGPKVKASHVFFVVCAMASHAPNYSHQQGKALNANGLRAGARPTGKAFDANELRVGAGDLSSPRTSVGAPHN